MTTAAAPRSNGASVERIEIKAVERLTRAVEEVHTKVQRGAASSSDLARLRHRLSDLEYELKCDREAEAAVKAERDAVEQRDAEARRTEQRRQAEAEFVELRAADGELHGNFVATVNEAVVIARRLVAGSRAKAQAAMRAGRPERDQRTWAPSELARILHDAAAELTRG